MIKLLFSALFESIENNQQEELKELLSKDAIAHINTLNNDGFSPLDVAVLLDNHSITKVLLLNGASAGYDVSENIENHLNTLIFETEQKLNKLVNTPASSSAQNGVISETEKQKAFFDKRIKLLRKMIGGWQSLQIPNSPFSFSAGEQIK